MEYILTKFKIKPGKKVETENFLKEIHENYQDDMNEVLKESKMVLG